MDCKNFGIGLIVLSATLFFGIAISEILEVDAVPESAVVEEVVVVKDCVPADPNVKYHHISEDKPETHKVKNVEEFKRLIDRDETESETERQLKKNEKEAELHNSSFQTLVFVQKCRAEKESQ